MYCFHMASLGRIRIQLVIDHPVNVLIDKIAGAERRSGSAVVEIASLEHAQKNGYDLAQEFPAQRPLIKQATQPSS